MVNYEIHTRQTTAAQHLVGLLTQTEDGLLGGLVDAGGYDVAVKTGGVFRRVVVE